ncbi:MAG TPA: beta-galactosidase, partial [Clostridia bacterium]|nr:beta-galactosidase [Clostridia bacterium]
MNSLRIASVIIVLCAFSLSSEVRGAERSLPYLQKQGNTTQLFVDGQPFVMLSGELHNSSSSSLEYLQPIWSRLKALNLNTVIASLSWELVEPEEGKYDFALLDGLIKEARRQNL